MYTDDDLERAVRSNIFDADAVERFRQQVAASQSTVLVDEENLRLVSGFNDMFVVIASALLLLSGFWHKARTTLPGWMPDTLQRRLPVSA